MAKDSQTGQSAFTSIRSHDRVAQRPDLLDLHFENIAGFEQHRRLTKDADAIRSATRDHIARLQRNP